MDIISAANPERILEERHHNKKRKEITPLRKTQITQQDMLLRLVNVLIQFTLVWNKIRAFADRREQLGVRLELIKTLAKDQELIRAGVRPERDRYRDLLINAMLILGGQILGWTTVTKDAKLRGRMAMSRTGLREAGLQLAGLAREVHDVASRNLEALADFGVTQDQVEQLDDLIKVYDALAGSPREAIKSQKTVTRLLDRELHLAMADAKEFFDPMMLQFEEREPEFFAAYQSARGTFKAPVRAKLDENGQPTAQWRIAKAKKAEERKAKAGTKAKKGSGSGSATTAQNPTGTVPLAN